MATITQARGFGRAHAQVGAPPMRTWGAEASNSGVPGDIVTAASGLAAFGDQNAATTGIIGILEQRISSATAGDPVPFTVVLPVFYYEFSLDGNGAAANRGVSYVLEDADVGAVIDNGTAGNVVQIIQFLADIGQFVTNSFIAEGGTSVTAGATNYPNASGGGVGDTDPRAIVCFNHAACGFSA